MAGDGHAMGVAAQILEHIFRAGRHAVPAHTTPVLPEQQSVTVSRRFWAGAKAAKFHGSWLAILEGALWRACELCQRGMRLSTLIKESITGERERIQRV